MLAALKKNEKGLTLIELLAVLVIVGIIAAIAIPAIGNTISNSKTKADAATDAMIKESVMRYLVDESITTTTSATDITVLVTKGYLNAEPTWQNTANEKTHFTATLSASNAWTVSLTKQP
ncbi:prepilin-type N-terminal cleavage/methylation domain-containing protein [Paenibacillus soyae]|uniref:prepilin-type N-terminal cleavage/methylation domain-containing protein n=1 Tax=Paenibacillus soyae TaxID=2969249 RepID=UPI0035302D7B